MISTPHYSIFRYAIVRFSISGVIAVVVQLIFLYTLVEFIGLWYLIAANIAFLLAFLASFILQKFWTFENHEFSGATRQFFVFMCIAIAMTALNSVFMYLFVDVFGWWYLFAQIIAMGIIAFISFLLYGSFVFNGGNKKLKKDTRHIFIATGLYPPDIGGPATYAKCLYDELPSRGFTVTIVSFSDFRFLPKGVSHLFYFFEIIQKSTHADIIFALDPVSVGFPALCAAKLLKKIFMIKVVGDYAWEQYCQRHTVAFQLPTSNPQRPNIEEFQKRRFDFLTEIRRWIEHFVARRARAVLVPSVYLKNIMRMWGVPPQKIHVIYNAFNVPDMKEGKDAARSFLGLSQNSIVSAGRLVPWKGFHMLIKMMPELLNIFPDAHLFIIGDGPERDSFKHAIETLHLETKVTLTGSLPRETLLRYILAADLFVLYTGYEGFSHQLLEVMAIGTPIITTNVGGNRELVEDKKTGFFVPLENPEALMPTVRYLLSDEGKKEGKRVVRAAQEKAQTFSKKRMIDALVEVLKANR